MMMTVNVYREKSKNDYSEDEPNDDEKEGWRWQRQRPQIQVLELMFDIAVESNSKLRLNQSTMCC